MKVLLAVFTLAALATQADSRASELIGMDVVNGSGEQLGSVSEVVFDTRTGALQTSREAGPSSWPDMGAGELIDREVQDRRHRDTGEIVERVLERSN